jgi:hypothetical protein
MLPDDKNFAVAHVAKVVLFPHAIRRRSRLGRRCNIENKDQNRKATEGAAHFLSVHPILSWVGAT